MAASVRIEDEAFADIRFKHLGALLGSNEYMALGVMAHLWRACTQLGVHVLENPLVAQIVDPALIIRAGLGEEVPGGVRLKGTEGRIEWLKKMRDNGRKGAQYGKLGGRPKKTPAGVRRGFEEKPLPAPAPAPAPTRGETTPASDTIETLAKEWAYSHVGPMSQKNEWEIAKYFREYVNAGTLTLEALRDGVRAKRNKSEAVWDFLKRISKSSKQTSIADEDQKWRDAKMEKTRRHAQELEDKRKQIEAEGSQ